MKQWTQEKLKQLYVEKEKNANRYDLSRANDSEQAGTPWDLLQRIRWFTQIPLSKWFDPVKLDPNFNTRDCADGLKIEWSYYTFVNPPFDKTRLFMVKSAIEWSKGKNIVLIARAKSFQGKFYDELFSKIGILSAPGHWQFDGFDNELDKPVQILYLLQPELLDYMEQRKADYNLKRDLKFSHQSIKSAAKKGPQINQEKMEQIKLAISKGWSRRVCNQNGMKISPKTFSKCYQEVMNIQK